jgi:hypothetical protein
MPTKLTRRKDSERQDCWHIYYGDVCAGTIARRTGCPVDVDPWEWGCGFYPGTEPGQGESGTAVDFETCRAEFEAAWQRLLRTRTEANCQEWRDQRDWTAKKYAMWARGELMPSQRPNSMMTCPCGQRFDSHDPAGSYEHRSHIYAAQSADGTLH